MIPPRTDPMVVMVAYRNDFLLFAKHIGTSAISGGMGKINDSKKEITAKNIGAYGF